MFKENSVSDSRLLYCGLLVLLSAACYIRVLGFGFLIIDDSLYVTNNPHVQQGLTLETIKWAFSTVEAEFWHPLTWLSLMLDSTLYGLLPRGFHSTSLLLHMAAGILLFLAFDTMTGKRGRSFVLAALFAVHPFHVEAVAWIAERKEVLCGFFWCAALFAYAVYVKKPCITRYLAVLILFCMGLMAKPMIVTFPFVLLLLDCWPLKRHLENGERTLPVNNLGMNRFIFLFMEKVPFFIFTAIAAGLTVYAQKAGQGIVGTDLYAFDLRIANAIVAYMSYLLKTLFPVNFSIFYPFRLDIPIGKVILSAAGLLSITAIVIIRMKKQPFLFTGWFWFLGTLVPVIGIVKIGDFAMADRYMYMPIVGILIAGIWLGADFFKYLPVPKRFPAVIAVILLLFAATGTWKYLEEWKTSEKLFQHAARTAAPNYFAHFALGHIYAGQQHFLQAEKQFQTAAVLRPDKLTFRKDLGRAIAAQGRFAEAIPHFEAVLTKKSDNAEANFYIGMAHVGTRDRLAALDYFLKALTAKDTANTQNFADLVPRLENLKAAGEYQQALELLQIDRAKESLKKLFIKGYDNWRHSRR